MKLKITMKNKETITLPLNRRNEITFKYDRVQFTQYYEIVGYPMYNLPENYYYEDIDNWKWEGF